MSEAKEGCALLEDVDEHTFVRFSQYAYTRDYVAADLEILLHSSAVANTQSAVQNGFLAKETVYRCCFRRTPLSLLSLKEEEKKRVYQEDDPEPLPSQSKKSKS